MTQAPITLVRVASAAHVDTARSLFGEYAQAIGTDLSYQGFDAELAGLPAPYAAPGGTLLIAHVGDAVAGCVGLRALDVRTAEMKRLYVRAACRGLGVGERLVAAATAFARDAGYEELRLDTLPTMASAQALYRRLGFIEIPPYGGAHLPGTRFYARALAA